MNMFGPSPAELLVAPARPTPASSESATPSVLRSTSPSKHGMEAIMSGTPNTAPRESVASAGHGAASAGPDPRVVVTTSATNRHGLFMPIPPDGVRLRRILKAELDPQLLAARRHGT